MGGERCINEEYNPGTWCRGCIPPGLLPPPLRVTSSPPPPPVFPPPRCGTKYLIPLHPTGPTGGARVSCLSHPRFAAHIVNVGTTHLWPVHLKLAYVFIPLSTLLLPELLLFFLLLIHFTQLAERFPPDPIITPNYHLQYLANQETRALWTEACCCLDSRLSPTLTTIIKQTRPPRNGMPPICLISDL